MKYVRNKVLFFITVVLLALFCVGCDNSVENGNGTGFVRFEEDSASRGLTVDDRLKYPVEDIYWAYTAVKVDGLHTTGESEEGGAAGDTGTNGTTAGGYKLRPVKNGPAAGLGVCSQEFAYGDWVFKIYGFKGYDGKKFSGLVYNGTTAESQIEVIKSTSHQEVNFRLEKAEDYPTEGMLAFGTMYFTVPQNMKFYKDSTITVSIKAGDKEIAIGTGTVGGSADVFAGTQIPVDMEITSTTVGCGKDGKFTEGTYYFKTEIKYQVGKTDEEDVAAEQTTPVVFTAKEFPVIFTGGVTTVLYGDIDDVKVNDGETLAEMFGVAVASTGSGASYVEYATLGAAVKADKGDVTLLADISSVGNVSLTKDVVVNMNGHFIRNLNISGAKAVKFRLGSSSREYVFSGSNAVLNMLVYSGNSVWINTKFGKLSVNAVSDTVYHSGYINEVNDVSVSKYFLDADVTEKFIAKKGLIDLNDDVHIVWLGCNPANNNDVKFRGKLATRIDNIDKIRDGVGYAGASMTEKEKTAYCTIVWDAYVTSVAKTTYGISGMFMNVPYIPFAITTGYTNAYWCSDKSGSGTTCSMTTDEAAPVQYAVGEGNVNFYGVWFGKVGGVIAYIKSDSTGAEYTFYSKVSGSTKCDEPVLGDDASNLSYMVVGSVQKTTDKFFVYNTTLCRYPDLPTTGNTNSTLKWYKTGAITATHDPNYVNYTYKGVTYSMAVVTGDNGGFSSPTRAVDTSMVTGKKNSAYILNIGNSGLSGAKFADETYAGDTSTIWYRLRQVNTSSTAAAYNNNTGMHDWFIPAIDDFAMMCSGGVRNVSTKPDSWTAFGDYMLSKFVTAGTVNDAAWTSTPCMLGGNTGAPGKVFGFYTRHQSGAYCVSGSGAPGPFANYVVMFMRSF